MSFSRFKQTHDDSCRFGSFKTLRKQPIFSAHHYSKQVLYTLERSYQPASGWPQRTSVSHVPNNQQAWHALIDDKPNAYHNAHNLSNDREPLRQLSHCAFYHDGKG